MAPTTPPAPVPSLSQALARKKANRWPSILLAIGIVVALGGAVLGYIESRRSEAVVLLRHAIPYGRQITADDLSTVEMPYYRPRELAGITDMAAVLGRYAARDLGANEIVQPPMLLAAPPDQPVYPNGQELRPDMVPMPFATLTIGPLSYRDRVNIGFNDQSGDPAVCDNARRAAAGLAPLPTQGMLGRPYACRLLSDLRVLYVDETEDIAYLELTPYQAHAIWAAQAAGLELWGERYGASSTPLTALDRLDIGQVSSDLLEPAPADDTARVPGADVRVPGDAVTR
jgi:hypothetical protein